MKIKALFFAACRDIVGNRELDLDVGEGSQVEDLKNVLLVKYPELATINNVLSIAVNAEYVDGNAILNPGDEVAFIPPVSGG
ncbi:MAG: molybdopterin converting factor subunit 1 [Gemmatimonadetes bacterium]|jgi:molybdopterin converting factor subunit 1|nr:molybdopterin converting factor subunit 1 [Gemmatimonadota bacterium]MBT5328407.1 molybdopterin converting factor subunit 1 [Gemmatimonadota bacterium]MBT5452144.1 molybdopterin converting factor subunit 1 [Gemmatimonadota bacterium]MBT5803126.1 molybdopterin converting factor subunit 1 [Gemmatimonadota bacterium]MBT6622191.1 molybdopterin converting factor subunit 1 [Gemmatimonadota bacterium]|tara:strand:- start:958 stop:1203 length:246 start_codon:yes stop_codon:yes gene_type:complete